MSDDRAPLYRAAHEVVEAYAERPCGTKRLDDAIDALDLELNAIDKALATLDELRARRMRMGWPDET